MVCSVCTVHVCMGASCVVVVMMMMIEQQLHTIEQHERHRNQISHQRARRDSTADLMLDVRARCTLQMRVSLMIVKYVDIQKDERVQDESHTASIL